MCGLGAILAKMSKEITVVFKLCLCEKGILTLLIDAEVLNARLDLSPGVTLRGN